MGFFLDFLQSLFFSHSLSFELVHVIMRMSTLSTFFFQGFLQLCEYTESKNKGDN